MNKFGLLHYFEKVVSSADVTYRKPSVKAFESVLKAIGALPSPEIYFIGNKVDKDAMGALSAGLSPILISKEPVVAPCVILPSLTAVKECLESSYLYVNNIADRESLVDGPGLRTVVFFQGCKKPAKTAITP